jgi:hypothetical protein
MCYIYIEIKTYLFELHIKFYDLIIKLIKLYFLPNNEYMRSYILIHVYSKLKEIFPPICI